MSFIDYALPIGAAALSAFSQGNTNRKNREWSENMWFRQNKVNLANWHAQNTYNSPLEQRKRMEAAGMNPALMYGGGQGGGLASDPKQADVKTDNQPPPRMDFMAYATMKKLGAETNLLKAQAEATRASAAYTGGREQREGQLHGGSLQIQQSELDNNRQKLKNFVQEAEESKSRVSIAKADNTRKQLMHKWNIVGEKLNASVAIKRMLQMDLDRAKTKQETSRIKSSIRNLKASSALMELDKELWLTERITRGTNQYFRVLDSVKEGIKNGSWFSLGSQQQKILDLQAKRRDQGLNPWTGKPKN